MFVDTSDVVVGARTFTSGGFDYAIIENVLRHVENACPGWQDRGVIVEAGANIGTTSLMLARCGNVIAFEPVPENVALLRHNVIANNLEARVDIRGVALSDIAGSVMMEVSADNSGDHRVRLNDSEGSFSEEKRHTVSVASARLDDEVGEQQVALVWMDTQGHEAQVLDGAPRLIASGTPFVIEYWPYGLRRAGGLERLEEIVAANFTTVVDTGHARGQAETFEARDIGRLRNRYTGSLDFTDLVLLH